MKQEDRYIYQVYCEGSFSKAAQKLYVTQPTLSLAIQRVEQQLQMPLFDRSSRPLALTDAGRAYIDTLEQEVQLRQDLHRQLEDIRNRNTGCVRLGGSHYINAYILPELLSSFQAQYPGIQIELCENDSVTLAQMLTDKQVDLTFSCNTNFIGDFNNFPAFYDHILLAVPRHWDLSDDLRHLALTAADIIAGKHLSEACPSVDLQSFREYPFILLKEGNNLHERCHSMFQDAGFSPLIKMELSQLVTAYRMAQHNIGITFVSDRLVESSDQSLCFFKLDHSLANRHFFLLMPKNMYISHATRTFVDHVRNNMN